MRATALLWILLVVFADSVEGFALTCAETCAGKDMWCAGETVGGNSPVYDCKAPDTETRRQEIAAIKATLNGKESQPEPISSEHPWVSNSYAGPLIGPVISLKNGGGTYFGFGGRLGTKLYQEGSSLASLGVYVVSISDSQTISGVKLDGQITALMAEFIGRGYFKSGFYLGGRFGIAFHSISLSSGSISVSGTANRFAVGPVVGYEFKLSPKASFVLDFSWLSLFKSTITITSLGSFDLDSTSALLPFAGFNLTW